MFAGSAASVRIGLHRLGLLGIVALALAAALGRSGQPGRTTIRQPNRGPERLHLFADGLKVVGWISGPSDRAGDTVTVTAPGVRKSLTVQPGNTFTWPCEGHAPTRAAFTLGKLRQTIQIEAPPKLPPCVFFAVDRGVYRPNQTLHFAAFLRDLDGRGEFVPRPGQTALVLLTSESKNLTAARLRLTADAQGRLTGDYTFSDADPLDTYRLSIPSYKGSARVTLAEYRKSKNHLTILGERRGGRLMLRFQGRDYLDRPVKDSRVQFTAEVVREAVRPEPGPLDGKQFAYAGEAQPPLLLPRELSAEERLLLAADNGWEAIGGLSVGRPRQVLVSLKDKLNLDDRGEVVYPVSLRPGWLRPGHSLVVQGVMIDGNGREERQTKTIPLTGRDDALQLSLPGTTFRVNEPIRVSARTREAARPDDPPTLIAMRLSPRQLAPFPNPLDDGEAPEVDEPITVADWGDIRGDLAAAAVFQGDGATLRLREPGAYRLTALWPRRDGPPLRQEIGCTVLTERDRPVLTLRLDRDRYQSGDTLTATVRGKSPDARVFLTLRDSVGLRLWKPLQLVEGKADVKLTLPDDIHYGCAVEVLYGDDEPPFIASRLVHVVPAGRMLTVRGEIKPVLRPGEQAVLNVQVNRKEPVDLIVSVYDKALLQIAPDLSPDIRNFYLADDRLHQRHARQVLERRLGGVKLGALFKQARDWLKKHPDKRTTAEGVALRSLLRNSVQAGARLAQETPRAEQKSLSAPDVATLLRLAGIRARSLGDLPSFPLPGNWERLPLAQWLNTLTPGPENFGLHVALIDDVFLLSDYHLTMNPQPWANPFPGMMGGFGGMGMMGLGGIGGIAGIGGGGFNQLGAQGGFQGNFQGAVNLGVGGGVIGFGGMIQPPSYQPPASSFSLSIRRNFADSAYWNARLRTDAGGKARVAFKLPDSLTGWQVVVTAVSKDMRVGRHETSFRTARPLMVQPILPRFFTEGDRVRVAANVHNLSDADQTVRVRLKAGNGKVAGAADKTITVEAHGSGTVSWDFQAGDAGTAELLMSAEAPAGTDAALKKLPVIRAGVEHVVTASGFCKDAVSINLPAGVDPARAVLEVRFAPTLTADLLDTLPFLVEYPYGCVEQTMSRFLPAIKVAQVLKQLRLSNPELERKLPVYVAAGIKRLLELQHEDGGWGWWVNDQTHVFMTAYALYGLLEAKKAGYPIGNADAIPRGVTCLAKFIESKSEAVGVADRVWCLYVWGQQAPIPQYLWDYLDERRQGGLLTDYALALALELAVQQEQRKLAAALADDLRRRARREAGEVHFRTGGFKHWGDDRFEVTAAALKALVAFDKDDPLIPGVLAYFTATKRGNRWNSTKDTALIIQALCDYLARRTADPRGRPHVALRCNDGPEQKATFAGPAESCRLIVPGDRLRAGANRLNFRDASDGMMFRAALRYHVAGRNLPAESHGIEVRRRWWLLDDKGQRHRQLKPGDEVPCGACIESIVVACPTDQQPMQFVLVENPRPAGCEVLPAADPRFLKEDESTPCLLREDRDKLIAFHHDHTDGQIVDRCVLRAEMPGTFLVSPAHVEMMYRTQTRGHSGTFTFRVAEH